MDDNPSGFWSYTGTPLYSGLTQAQRNFMASITPPDAPPLLDDAARYTTPPDERPLARVLPFRRRGA